MDAWVLGFSLGISFICLALQLTYRGYIYGLIGGLITLLTLARLIFDDALIIGHECCASSADIPLTLGQNDLDVVAMVLAAFALLQFAMVIEQRLSGRNG